MTQDRQQFSTWAIVEVLGHNTFVGYVTEELVAGTAFVRVDVPETDGQPAFTKLIGAGSIYAITPVSEDVARRAARHFRREPLSVWQLPDPPAITSEPQEDFEEEDIY